MHITITPLHDSPIVFRSAADALRWVAKNSTERSHSFGAYSHDGSARNLGPLFAPPRGRNVFETDTRTRISEDDYAHLYRVYQRYREFLHHMEEIDPEWYEESQDYWADNSVESLQRSRKYPERTRRVQVEVPSGDACY